MLHVIPFNARYFDPKNTDPTLAMAKCFGAFPSLLASPLPTSVKN